MDIVRLSKKVFEIVDFRFEGELETADEHGIYVKFDGAKAIIGGECETAFCRGCFLLAKHIKNGENYFEIRQTADFESCGVMIDVSRNAVMTVEAVERYIDRMAALGLNTLMLYTEDTYEIKEYPYFGYMRGRYSPDELKAIDKYALSMGVELIPCIQTLAHLEQYLKYECAAEYRDTNDILLIGEEKTYEFIEAAIKSMSEVCTSDRIHLGMDEAHFVGLGEYLNRHGYEKRYTLINRHLNRVAEICKKYGLRPMMWSDMYFRILSPTGWYDADVEFTQEMLAEIPDVDMVYWDYNLSDEQEYYNVLQAHERMKKGIVFAGGFNVWHGFLPWFQETWVCSNAALSACKNKKVKTVIATMWGDDGNETNAEYALSLLPIFSEYCYGEGTREEIAETSELLTGVPFEATELMDCGVQTGQVLVKVKEWIYSDILYDIGKHESKCGELPTIYAKKEQRMLEFAENHPEKRDYFRYAAVIFGIARIKSELRLNLRKNYKQGNGEYLLFAAEQMIPELEGLYKELYVLHKKQWDSVYKPFGWEVLSFRYGGLMQRMAEVRDNLSRYAAGELTSLSELEEETLQIDNFNAAKRFITASNIF